MSKRNRHKHSDNECYTDKCCQQEFDFYYSSAADSAGDVCDDIDSDDIRHCEENDFDEDLDFDDETNLDDETDLDDDANEE